MKQYITPEDLLSLSDSQKLNLRDMWMPQVNTLGMARICKDVINDEYDSIVFAIGEVIVQEGSGHLVLRRYKLLDESFFEEHQALFNDEDEDDDDLEIEEDFEFEYAEPEQYFSKDDCLPILSIGQLIEMLNKTKYGQDGFDISISPLKKMVGDKGHSVINRMEHEFVEDELCDALWNALAESL